MSATKRLASCLIVLLMNLGPVRPAVKDKGLISEPIVDALLDEVSAERAMESVYAIVPFDRITASRAYDRAAEYVLETLKNAGIPEASIETFPALWKPDYYLADKPLWLDQPGWTVHKAVLRTVDPEAKIADYGDEPNTLALMSRSFRGRAELVFVENGNSDSDYAGIDVKGKVVLARGPADRVHELAVLKRDAVGVVCFGGSSYHPLKGRGHPDMVVWRALSPVANDAKKPQFAFSLSDEKGQYLLSLLRTQKVELEIDIETEFYPNDLKIVTARIPGTSMAQEEFLFYAHLDHAKPSAGDNASGCAALIETARALSTLIAQGRIPPPRRSIRFVWGPEGPGSFMYIMAHGDRLPSTLAGLNLDMVGEDPGKTHSILRVVRNPDSLPSFMEDLVGNVIDSLDTRLIMSPGGTFGFMNYRFMPFAANSDHAVFNDGGVRVPMMMFNYSPDAFHHTNLDTPDKLEATELKRILFLSAATATFIAGADDDDAYDLAQIVASNGAGRVARALQNGLALLRSGIKEGALDDLESGRGYLRLAAKREEGAIRSCARLCTDDEVKKRIDELTAGIVAVTDLALTNLDRAYRNKWLHGKSGNLERAPTPDETKASRVAPRRIGRHLNELWEWDLELRGGALDQADRDFIEGFKNRFVDAYIRIPEILNFVDGRNTLLDIRNFVSSEFFGFMTASEYVGHPEDLSPEYRRLALADLLRLMAIFKKGGLVDY